MLKQREQGNTKCRFQLYTGSYWLYSSDPVELGGAGTFWGWPHYSQKQVCQAGSSWIGS